MGFPTAGNRSGIPTLARLDGPAMAIQKLGDRQSLYMALYWTLCIPMPRPGKTSGSDCDSRECAWQSRVETCLVVYLPLSNI